MHSLSSSWIDHRIFLKTRETVVADIYAVTMAPNVAKKAMNQGSKHAGRMVPGKDTDDRSLLWEQYDTGYESEKGGRSRMGFVYYNRGRSTWLALHLVQEIKIIYKYFLASSFFIYVVLKNCRPRKSRGNVIRLEIQG